MTRTERRIAEAARAAALARLRDAEAAALARYNRTDSLADRWAWVEARRAAHRGPAAQLSRSGAEEER